MDHEQQHDEVVELCTIGLLPKLSFLLEEREEYNLKTFFENPNGTLLSENATKNAAVIDSPLPLAVSERKRVLVNLMNRVEEDASLNWWAQLTPKSRINIILFLSESCDGAQLWSNSDCSDLVIKICDEISRRVEKDDNSSKQNGLLVSWFTRNQEGCLTPNQTDFYHILQLVKSKHTKSDWKYFPASVHGFRWIIQQISTPLLTNYIDLIIPPALLFSDDHYDDYKVSGLKILAHIVSNSEKTDLIRNNWASVIYDAVQRHCTDKDPVVIHLMMSILLKVLEIIEKNPSAHCSEFTRYDHLFKQILFQMEFSSDLNQKQAWLPVLNNYMNILGLASLHWSDKICDVLRDYTTCSNVNIWKAVLDVTETLIKNTWPKPDCYSITEIIIRVIFNTTSVHGVCLCEKEKLEISDKAFQCIQLLHKCVEFINVKGQLQDIVDHKYSAEFQPDFLEKIKRLLE